MIQERVILPRVEELQKRGPGIAAGPLVQLVNLVDEDHRIHLLAVHQSAHELAGLGS